MAEQPDPQAGGGQPIPASEEQREQVRESTGVDEPAKLLRIASTISQVLPELRGGSLDEESRRRLLDMQRHAVAELKELLDPELASELEDMTLPFDEDDIPSDTELQIAQAQLTGWLDGLLRGIQATFMVQQMQAQQQLGQLRRKQLEGGQQPTRSGQYL